MISASSPARVLIAGSALWSMSFCTHRRLVAFGGEGQRRTPELVCASTKAPRDNSRSATSSLLASAAYINAVMPDLVAPVHVGAGREQLLHARQLASEVRRG